MGGSQVTFTGSEFKSSSFVWSLENRYSAPLIRYLTVSKYREDIANGIERYPHIINSWFPFDDNAMPGYVYASAIQIIMSIVGSGSLAAYDTTAFAIMIFMKGQLIILKNNCKELFRWETKENNIEFFAKIKECHRHHDFLKR
ncbi:hypothetical protein evm_006012 [Chilo suppressalis]|nr:hypothetical protein evm_006012 [Chilo suppressalis]